MVFSSGLHQEIERKFLVSGEYKGLASGSSRIIQGYICVASGRTVRVRIVNKHGYLTIKGPAGKDKAGRMEWEKEISHEDALALLTLCEAMPIDKTRWFIPNGKHIVEVDEFHGLNEGLVIAEIELSDADEAYERPSFLAQEVTTDRRYYNSYIAKHPYSSWHTI